MGFLIVCLIIWIVIYSVKKENFKQHKSDSSTIYNSQDIIATDLQYQNYIEGYENIKLRNDLLNTTTPPVKSKSKNCIKFISNSLKFKYLVCGDFYFFQDSKIIFEATNVHNYALYVLVEGKGYRQVAKFKEKRGTTIDKLNDTYDDWILLVNKVTKLYESPEKRCSYFDSKIGLCVCSDLEIYHNGTLVKTLINNFTNPKVNNYGEILYTNSKGARNKLNILDNSVKNVQKGTAIQCYNLDFKQFKELHYEMLDEQDNVCFYFYKKECDSFYIVNEFCKNADCFSVIPNKFEDDIETINYCAKYNKSRIKDIAFMLYALDRTPNNRCAFSATLFDGAKRSNTCGGSAVYKLPMMDFYKGLEGKYASMNEESQHFLTLEQKQNFKTLVKIIYDKYGLDVNYTELPKEFFSNLVAEDLMYKKVFEFLFQFMKLDGRHDKNYKCINPVWETIEEYKNEMKPKYNEIKQSLIEQGVIVKKWKSEIELFRTAYAMFPDSIYQYRISWLGLQSLDIFIPS